MSSENSTTNIINYQQFADVEIRIGLVVSVNLPEWSNKLLEMTVDFGSEIGQKTIFSGIKSFYQPADIEGKMFPFVVNLAERKMGEGVSQGMMLMADTPDKPILMPVVGANAGDLVR